MGRASTKSKNKWNTSNYDRVALCIRKGTKDLLKAAAQKKQLSLAMYVKNAISKQYKADMGEEVIL